MPDNASASTPIAPVVTAIDRITIAVRDLAFSERVYTRLLGREPSWRRLDGAGGTEHVLYTLDNLGVELLSPVGEGVWGQRAEEFLEAHGEGILVLFLKTEDSAAAAATLTERGIPTVVLPENEVVGLDGSIRRWRNALVLREGSRHLSIILTEHRGPPLPKKPAPLRPDVSEEAAISAMDHVVVMTSDAEACKAMFGDRFGIRLALDHTKPEWGVRQLFFRLGGVTLEVVESLDKAKAPKVDFFWGVAWKAKDIHAVHARLTAEGVELSDVRKGRKKGTEISTIRPPTGGVPTLLISQSEVDPK
jgi:catechol 2,3-dioxygenase-like lactoylglutathione lyase family enzyme